MSKLEICVIILYNEKLHKGELRAMKRICKYCFNFVDRSYKICPICHRRVDGKSPERVNSSNNAFKSTKLVDEKPEIPEIQSDELHKIHWVPKKEREGYTKDKSKQKNVRIEGRHIDVSRIAIFNEEQEASKYTPKKLHTEVTEDDYKLRKLEWWEIYRRADRMLVRRKLNKVVKKQACVKPKKISQLGMFILCLIGGFIGLHDFYAKNIKRGTVTLGLFTWAISLVALMDVFPWISYVQYSLIALPGLVCLMRWVWDLLAIITKRYVYKESKLNFIYSLDVQTRARLGNKYIAVPNWYEYKKEEIR